MVANASPSRGNSTATSRASPSAMPAWVIRPSQKRRERSAGSRARREPAYEPTPMLKMRAPNRAAAIGSVARSTSSFNDTPVRVKNAT